MANPDTFDDAVADAPGLPPVSRLAGWLGAVVSVALVAAAVWWAVDLALRDARGVPVVRAMEGPARVAPEDPGGFEADHQGLAVNEIASETEGTLAERVVLAPEPVGPAEEDAPVAAIAPQARDDALRSAVGAAVLEAIGAAPAAPEAGPADATVPLSEIAPEEGAANGAADGPRRPMPRPALDIVTRAAPGQALPEIATPVRLDPAAIPPGTRLVQLGAFDSPEAAEQSWERLSTRFGTYLSDKAKVVEHTVLSGVDYWRLRAHGFEGLSDARSFCAVLLAEQADCIPVLTR